MFKIWLTEEQGKNRFTKYNLANNMGCTIVAKAVPFGCDIKIEGCESVDLSVVARRVRINGEEIGFFRSTFLGIICFYESFSLNGGEYRLRHQRDGFGELTYNGAKLAEISYSVPESLFLMPCGGEINVKFDDLKYIVPVVTMLSGHLIREHWMVS